MENLPADVLRKTALELGPRDVLSLCLTNRKFKESVCNSAAFWRNKIQIDHPNQTSLINLTKMFQENPKDLYMILTMNSKIVEISRYTFPFLYEEFKDEEEIEDGNQMFLDALNEILNVKTEKGKDFILKNMIKRGDVLHIEWVGDYRNDGKFMWDGEKAVNLDINDDDYGSVPSSFSFPEFRPDYFGASIDHNNIVRLSPEKMEEAIQNFSVNTQTSYITDKYGNKFPVKLSFDNVDEKDLKVKFGKIFFSNGRDYLDYEPDEKVLLLHVPSGGSSYSSKEGSRHEIRFGYPEWKDAIVSIVPSWGTSYEWKGDTLNVVTKR